MTTSILDLEGESFVSLTTYRRSGEPVSTPVWIARDADALVVTTGADSGKVKRLRRDPRVALRPRDRRGRVADDAPTRDGVAAVLESAEEQRPRLELLARKYGLQYRLLTTVERVVRRGSARVVLRLRDA